MPAPPLAHLRVVELTDLRGALAGRLLADLGADVIKVEPAGGDSGRLRPPFVHDVPAADRSLAFLYRNTNKRGAVIDLHAVDGQRRLSTLLERADILIENLGAAGQRRHGLTPAEVHARHPHLVHVAISDCGLSGPRAGWRLEPLPAFAASGALYASGFPTRPPCWLAGYVAHDCAAVFGVIGALTAVLDRARHGAGQAIEVSVEEAALSGLNPWAIPLPDYTRLYPAVPAAPPRNADSAYLVLPVADGFVRVVSGTRRHWQRLQALLGNPEAFAGPEWEMAIYRLANADVVRLVATEALAHRTRAEVFAEAQRLGLPLAPVNTPDQFVAEAQTRARGYFRRTGFPGLGDAPVAVAPFELSATPVVLRRPAPAAGEDTDDFPPRAVGPLAGGAGGPVLAGMRVVHFGTAAVVPELAWVLAELGAEVIKIESRVSLDALRAVTVEPDAPNRAWTFNDECRGQKSVCLDLTTARGRELALGLCATADVVAENSRGGVMRNLGLDYDDVRRVRPDVIYVASQGLGRGGPLGEMPAFGPLNAAFAGVNALWNYPDSPYPAGSSLNHPDHIAGKLLATAVLAALIHRQRSGEGQRIDMAQSEAAAFLAGEFYLAGPLTGRPAGPHGNEVDYAVPHDVYPCAGEDRWCAIAVADDAAWARLVAYLGWPAEPALATLAGRQAARAEIDARLAAWTRTREPWEVAAALQAAGVSAMPVVNGLEQRADPHLAARSAFVTVEHPEVGAEQHCGNPLRLGRTPLVTTGPAPLLGADTEVVLVGVLGLDRAEVARLVEEGICR